MGFLRMISIIPIPLFYGCVVAMVTKSYLNNSFVLSPIGSILGQQLANSVMKLCQNPWNRLYLMFFVTHLSGQSSASENSRIMQLKNSIAQDIV